MGIGKDIDSKKIFVDREPQRHAFKRHLIEIDNAGVNANGMVLIYSGVGGIGKTQLLREFEKIAAKHNKKFIRHNFYINGIEMLETLKVLRKELGDKYQMEFPLFDKGCIYLAQKNGTFVSSEQQKSILRSSSMFRSFKKNFSSANIVNDRAAALAKIGKPYMDDDDGFWDSLRILAEDTLEITPVFKLAKPVLDFIDDRIAYSEETARKKGNKVYKITADELEARNREVKSAYIEEFLPTLFAQDLTFWLEDNDTDLIIFLDTYELLTGEESGNQKTVRLISEDTVPVDWWIGKLLAADRVMWVIAGRYKLEQIGTVNLNYRGCSENYSVDVLDNESANKYLKLLGIEEEEIRDKIIEVTGGHPFYMGKCFVTYNNKRSRGEILRPSDFGESRDEVIKRAVGSFDEGSLPLVQKLCILGRWTSEIFREMIPHNPNIYKRLKQILTEKSSVDLNGDKFVIYTFDRIISSFLLPGLKQDEDFATFFSDIRANANAYFKKFFAKSRDNNGKAELYFTIWSDIILRTTDAPADILTLYEENFLPLEERFDISTREIVIQKFLAKVGDTQNLSSAYFQDRLGRIYIEQHRIKDALKLEKAAYLKTKTLKLSGTEYLLTIRILNGLAEVLHALRRYTAEIALREKIVRDCESFLPEDIATLIANKKPLAQALEHGDRNNDALKVRREILEALDGYDDEQYIKAADELAAALEDNDDNEAALPLRRKIVAFCEGRDEAILCAALNNLITTLNNFHGKDYLEEKANLYRQYMALYEKTACDCASVFKDFSDTLKKLGRNAEVAQVYQNLVYDLEQRIEAADKNDVQTVELMCHLVELMRLEESESQVAYWEGRLQGTVRNLIEKTCREPIADYDAALSTLEGLLNLRRLYEDFDIKQKILALTERKPGVKDSEVIAVKEKLINELRLKKSLTDEERAEVEQLFEEIENYYRKNFFTSREIFPDTLRKHANFLAYVLSNPACAVEKLKGGLALLQKDSETPANEIIATLKTIADILGSAGNHSEELFWRERILNFCKAQFVEDAPEALEALSGLISTYENLGEFGKAEGHRQILVAVAEKNFGSSHMDAIKAKENLAHTLHCAGKYADEIILREKIIELYRENFSANAANRSDYRQRFIRSMEQLALILDATGHKKQAVVVRKQIIPERKEYLQELKEDSARDLKIITATQELVRDLQRVGDHNEEIRYRREIVDFRQSLKALKDLAEAYARCDKAHEALKIYRELAEICGENYPPEIFDNPGNENANATILADIQIAELFVKVSNLDTRLMIELDNAHDEETFQRVQVLESLRASLEEIISIYGADSDKTKLTLNSIARIRDKFSGDAQALERFDRLFGTYIKDGSSAIDKSKSLSLCRGQRVPLTKNNPALDKLIINFTWESTDDMEIDASAFLLAGNDKAAADEDFIFYGNTDHHSAAVQYLAETASMHVALKKIPAAVKRIAFALTIYEANKRGQTFDDVKIFVRVIDEAAQKELLRFDLLDGFSIESAVVVGEIYRHKGHWKFNAIGAGFDGGLKALCESYGLEVN